MLWAIKQHVTVQPGGKVEVQSPELPVGAEVEVIVLFESAPSEAAKAKLEALDKLQKSLNLTPEAAKKWADEVRAERQSWGPGE